MSKTYLYRMFDAGGNLLYVGISKSVLKRLGEHLNDKDWLPEEASIKWTTYPTRTLAEAAERRAIQNESPEWNIIYANSYLPEKPVLPEDLAEACIRSDGQVKHYRLCKMRQGGSYECKWEDVVVRIGFCCRKGFSRATREGWGRYRIVMNSYLEAYMKVNALVSANHISVIELDGQYPDAINPDCGLHK